MLSHNENLLETSQGFHHLSGTKSWMCQIVESHLAVRTALAWVKPLPLIQQAD